MHNLHRILSGSPLTQRELRFAGIFVLAWFGMDVVEFYDWAWQKFNPAPTAICLPVRTTPMPPISLTLPGIFPN